MVFPTKSGRLARLVRHRTSSSGGTNLEEHRHFARPLWKKTRSRLDRSWNKSERTYGQASFGSVSFHNRNKLEPLGVDVSWGQRKRHGFPRCVSCRRDKPSGGLSPCSGREDGGRLVLVWVASECLRP